MHLDPLLPPLAATALAVLLTGLIARRLGQPFLTGCLAAGVLLGTDVLGVLDDSAPIHQLGALGVVLLLFFVGMEVCPHRLLANWRGALFGTAAQIAASVICAMVIGLYFDWPPVRSLLMGFVISLSSTAVVLRLLRERGEMNTPTGQRVVAILLAQDVAIVPMLLVIAYLADDGDDGGASLPLQLAGGLLLLGFVVWLMRRKELRLPFASWLESDEELRVFGALVPCLVLAVGTGLLGLSSGLGAFVGGMMIAMTREARIVADSLKPFEVVFVGVFFVSVGLLVDLDFLRANLGTVLVVVGTVLATNTLINAVILKSLGGTWRDGIYGGAILAQIGEFSFVLVAVGKQAGVIGEYGYQTTVAAIALSLALSPAWIAGARFLARPAAPAAPSAADSPIP